MFSSSLHRDCSYQLQHLSTTAQIKQKRKKWTQKNNSCIHNPDWCMNWVPLFNDAAQNTFQFNYLNFCGKNTTYCLTVSILGSLWCFLLTCHKLPKLLKTINWEWKYFLASFSPLFTFSATPIVLIFAPGGSWSHVANRGVNMTSKSEAVEFLFENPPELAIATADVLLRVANNVLQNPENPKYRTLRIANAIVSTKLLPVSGGMECLFEMGFEEVRERCKLRRGSRILVRGPSRVLTPRGALSPKFAPNRGFSLKLPENYMILKKSCGQWGGGGPWIRYWNSILHFLGHQWRFLVCALKSFHFNLWYSSAVHPMSWDEMRRPPPGRDMSARRFGLEESCMCGHCRSPPPLILGPLPDRGLGRFSPSDPGHLDCPNPRPLPFPPWPSWFIFKWTLLNLWSNWSPCLKMKRSGQSRFWRLSAPSGEHVRYVCITWQDNYFFQDSENLTLPLGNSCLQRLRRTRDKLEAAKVRLQKKDSKPAEVPQAAAAASSSQVNCLFSRWKQIWSNLNK